MTQVNAYSSCCDTTIVVAQSFSKAIVAYGVLYSLLIDCSALPKSMRDIYKISNDNRRKNKEKKKVKARRYKHC